MVLLFIWVVLYIIWTFLFLCYERWKKRKSDKSVAAILPRKDGLTTNVIGESTFILPVSKPLGANMKPVGATTEKVENQSEKDSTFVPDSDNHPLQVPDEELDGMFDDAPPEGETNDPMDVEVSMDYEEDEEEDTPEQVPSDTIASGISFENMCAAVKVLNQPKGTVSEQEERQAGRTLLELQHTDVMQQIVSSEPKKNDRISELISLHLDTFRKQQGEAEEETEIGNIPDNFGINDIV